MLLISSVNADNLATKGWYYYETPPVLQLESQDQQMFYSSKQLLDEAKKEYEEIEAAAIINPSPDNIKAYRQAMQLVSDRTAKLAMLTATQNWQDPDSRLSVEAVNGSGLQQDLDTARREYSDIVKNYGLFYFISKDCKYCNVEANELKRLEMTYGINIMAVSMDDSTLPQYPNPLKDNGFSVNLGISKPGALVAFDVKKNKAVVIGYGYLHYDEIMKRIHALFISGTAYPDEYVKTDNPERISK
jgi:conjugal transfer pilus assembly protein TraF